MFYKKHRTSSGDSIVGICDSNLIGQTLQEDEICITIHEDFFKDMKATEEEILLILQEENNITLVGNQCVSLAIKNGLLNESSCMRIHGELYAQLLRL